MDPTEPDMNPTKEPYVNPTKELDANPTKEPDVNPTKEPDVNPTKEPDVNPTNLYLFRIIICNYFMTILNKNQLNLLLFELIKKNCEIFDQIIEKFCTF